MIPIELRWLVLMTGTKELARLANAGAIVVKAAQVVANG